MAATDRITMTMRELDRFKVIQSVVDGLLKPWRAIDTTMLAQQYPNVVFGGWCDAGELRFNDGSSPCSQPNW